MLWKECVFFQSFVSLAPHKVRKWPSHFCNAFWKTPLGEFSPLFDLTFLFPQRISQPIAHITFEAHTTHSHSHLFFTYHTQQLASDMDGWETVTHEPKQQWGSNNFLSNQGFGDGWGAATSEPQAQSSGRGGAIGGGHSDWQQMTAQMESTFIGNGFEQRDVGPQEGMNTSDFIQKQSRSSIFSAAHTQRLPLLSLKKPVRVAVLLLLKKVSFCRRLLTDL